MRHVEEGAGEEWVGGPDEHEVVDALAMPLEVREEGVLVDVVPLGRQVVLERPDLSHNELL
eukprot:10747945-Heterocapsa_arctica.AAC.1